MALLGQRYGNDPRLGYVDIGGYGRAGSWRIDPATDGAPITDANRKRLVAAVATAFPHTWILINTSTDVPFTRWVLDTYPHAGLRTDNLGVPNMASSLPVSPELQNYWTTRPIFSAWAPTADVILGATQVRQWHVSTVGPRDTSTMTDAQLAAFDTAVKTAGYRFVVVQAVVPRLSRGATASISVRLRNDGSAPIYQARTLTLQLRSGTGTIAASTPSTIDIRRILPGTANVVAPLKVPVTVAKGTYDLTLIATDPSGYAPPLGFANTTFTADGAVVLGSVSVP